MREKKKAEVRVCPPFIKNPNKEFCIVRYANKQRRRTLAWY